MQGPTFTTYIQELPLTTRVLFAVNVGVFLLESGLELLNSFDIYQVAICLLSVRSPNYQYYRIVTSAFTHGSLQHIAFNGFALLGLGRRLEKQLGSLGFLALTGVVVLLTGLLYLGVCLGLSFLPEEYWGGETWNYHCAVGYSGVLFTYLYIECHFNESDLVVLNVRFSRRLLPWALLAVTQLVMWNSASFLGHLCGILVGIGYSTRLLCCVMPRYGCLEKIEGLTCCNVFHNMDSYVDIPEFKPAQRGMRKDPSLIPLGDTELSEV
jgi:membrane associated rhomboid family serine protease